jgi:hypothetical protein
LRDENEWWALAQHNGMATPLLDWTESPFVALYFAFESEIAPPGAKRAVWAVSGNTDKKKHSGHLGDVHNIIQFIRPMQDENARLVSQSALFTRVPLGETVDTWISNIYANQTSSAPLIKIVIPNTDRSGCLRTLNKMNINHLSLFPDLFGAAEHCNKSLSIRRY